MEVVGHQFDFEYRYPGVATSLYSPKDEMHLPVGVPVRVLLSSADVLHRFWVPEFRVKLATVPGLVQDMNFTPLRTGTFDIACSEYCGVAHSKMQGKVVVESQADFNKWLSALKGHWACRAPFRSRRATSRRQDGVAAKCAACHAVGPFDQKVVGPGLGPDRRRRASEPRDGQGADARQHRRDPRERLRRSDRQHAERAGQRPLERRRRNLVAYLVSLK